MSKNKHLTIFDRNKIVGGLLTGKSLRNIAIDIEKDVSTVSREIKAHMVIVRKGAAYQHGFNDCIYRNECNEIFVCDDLNCTKDICRNCGKCIKYCSRYKKEECSKREKPPYVCNGCKIRAKCHLEKRTYDSILAQKQYKEVLKETRSGIAISEAELQYVSDLTYPLLRKGQSLHHIYETHKDEILVSERTLYSFIKQGSLEAGPLDMPRMVKYKLRVNTNHKKLKVDKKCYIGRSYADYNIYLAENPDIAVVQMDSVIGTKGSNVLLTIHFINCSLMLAFLRDRNDSKSVIAAFNKLNDTLGINDFKKLFPLSLGDRGSEFSNPKAIENTIKGKPRTKVFYCDAMASWQKGQCEVNHEFIRRVVPKGTCFDFLTQEKVNMMMNHINSYKRAKLGNNSPYEIFEKMYGIEIIKKLGLKLIEPDEIILKPSLIK
jgi:IS30 family transposase